MFGLPLKKKTVGQDLSCNFKLRMGSGDLTDLQSVGEM